MEAGRNYNSFYSSGMQSRQVHTLLNHSTPTNAGYITDCRFDRRGQNLAVADAQGSICIYSLSNSSELRCRGEFSSGVTQTGVKDQNSVRSMRWLGVDQAQPCLATNHEDSIKIWKIDSSDIFNCPSGPDEIKIVGHNLSHQSLKPQLRQKISVPCQAISLSPNGSQIILQGKQSVTLWNVERRTTVYEKKPLDASGLPVTKRLHHESRTDYQQRIEAELNYWNSLDFVTSSKFQNSSNDVIGYSDKLGCVNLIDLRSKNSLEPTIKFKNSNRNSVVEVSLAIPSDFVVLENEHDVISRDFLYVYKWDTRNPKNYTSRLTVYPSINNQICELYQEGEIYNRFSLLSNATGSTLFTNHFENSFHEMNFASPFNRRYSFSKIGMSVENVASIHPIPNLHQTKVLRSYDYCQSKNIVAVGIGNKLQLLGSP